MNISRFFAQLILINFLLLDISGCSNDQSEEQTPLPGDTVNQFTISGTLTGLTSAPVYLELAIDQKVFYLDVTTNGSFGFSNTYGEDVSYLVTITQAPAHQTCVLTNGSGTIAGSDVTDIAITCTDRSKYTVGGTISGLEGTLVLTGDFNSTHTTTAVGGFAFPDPEYDTFTYNVWVDTQPAGQLCTITNSTGTITGMNVNNVLVDCKDNVNPTGTVQVPDIIQSDTPVIILFDETMDTNLGLISGTLYDESDGGVWSTTSVPNDTLTFSPLTAWTSNSTATDTDYGIRFVQLVALDPAGNDWQDHLTFIVVTKTPYFVDTNAADDSGNGLSPATAKKTIKAAIDTAIAPAVVAISKGTFQVTSDTSGTATHIVLKEDVSLIGGFPTGFISYQGISDGSVVTDTSALATGNATAPNRVLEANSSITNKTLVTHITFNGSTVAGADYTAGAWVHSGSSPALYNSIFNGGSGSLGSYGLMSTDSTPELEVSVFNGGDGPLNAGLAAINSTLFTFNSAFQGGGGTDSFGLRLTGTSGSIVSWIVDGGSGSSSSTGIYSAGSSNPILSALSVNGGSSPGVSYGLYNDSSAPTIMGLAIDGGNSTGTSYGIYNDNSSASIGGNYISGGSGAVKAVAIFNTGSAPNIFNNILLGGSGSAVSMAIDNSGSSPTIRNNTIDAGLNSTTAYGIHNQLTSNPVIENNIIFRSAATTSYCIYENDANADPAQVQNNDLYSCGTALYYNFVDGTGCSSNDECLVTNTEVNALVDTIAAANISIDPMFISLTSNPPTFSNLLFTISSPTSVTAGGLNGNDQGGWGFINDLAEVVRPGTGIPWAIGPLEP